MVKKNNKINQIEFSIVIKQVPSEIGRVNEIQIITDINCIRYKQTKLIPSVQIINMNNSKYPWKNNSIKDMLIETICAAVDNGEIKIDEKED